MSGVAILQPVAFALDPARSSAGMGLDNLASPHPREAFAADAAGATTIALDLGVEQAIDMVLLGFTNLPEGATVELRTGLGGETLAWAGAVAPSYRRAPARHAVAILEAPVVARHLRLVVAAPAALVAGVVAVGLSIRPASGHEWGSGRPVTDTSQVSRLFDGAFGVERGVVAGGWQWTMPALTDEEVERLYALLLDVGIGGSLLVVERTDEALPRNEAIHWGLLTKLEPYARQQPGESTWTMQVQDWA